MNAKGHQQYERGDILYEKFSNTESETEFIERTIRNLRGKVFKDNVDKDKTGLDYLILRS
jgi:DNA helicase II / ATP-dependent DNA helicase PcrA